MTNLISPYVQPLLDLWDHFTLDKRWADMNQYPGEWHTRFLKHEKLRVQDTYNSLWNRYYHEPSLSTTLSDNVWRFSLLAFVERWVTIRQSQQFLKSRFLMTDNNVGALNGLRGNGILGAFRGNGWNIFHFIAVHYHALHYANNDPLKYIFFSSVFEAAFYPIDTIRTLYYADVNRTFKNTFDCVTKVIEKGGYKQFYRGVDFKVFYNVLFGLNLWSFNNDSYFKYLTLPLWLSSYAVLSLKTRLQVAGSPLSFQLPADPDLTLNNIVRKEGVRGLYSGFIPFALLNLGFCYCLPGLLPESKKRAVLDEVKKSAIKQDQHKYWA